MASKPLDALTRLEALAEQWLEGGFARLFRTRLHRAELAEQLLRALEDGRTAGPDGIWLAPDEYQVFLHPDDYARLGSPSDQTKIEKKLTHQLIELAQQSGLTLVRRPRVHLRTSNCVPPRQVQVQTRLITSPALAEGTSETREIDTHQAQEKADVPPSDVTLHPPPTHSPDDHISHHYLLVSERHIALTASPINLGRGLDNDVVIDHPRVSRHHAQLRQREGQWWLIDLSSANGTAVNDQPISEAILHPGDVISLAGVEIRLERQMFAPE
jgi:hypothetical protein